MDGTQDVQKTVAPGEDPRRNPDAGRRQCRPKERVDIEARAGKQPSPDAPAERERGEHTQESDKHG